jgi:26S proteasome regulatory subunit N9
MRYTQILEKEQSKPVLIDFYESFIRDLETKINYLMYAKMVIIASRCFEKRSDANTFLTKIKDRLGINIEAQILLRIEIAGNMLLEGLVVETGDALVQIRDEIDKATSIDSLIYSGFYRVYALYFDRRKDYEEFYQYALQYLAYTPAETFKQEEMVEWSVKMCMAVMLGKKIYNIGELAEKEILKSLTKTSYVWLYDLLQSLNDARVQGFLTAIEKYKAHIEAVPEIKESLAQLNIKIRILSVLDLIFTKQKEERNIKFEAIAATAEIKIEDVEWLLMKAMSLGLIKGEIDQVDQMVKVTWMKPRILDPQRVQIMRDSLDKWKAKVQTNLKDLESKTSEIAKP